jgi:hypothetical protein
LLPDDERTNRLLSHSTAGHLSGPATMSGRDPGDAAEALRVLYVAVTRARRLIALALPDQHITPVAQHLRRLGVQVDTEDQELRVTQMGDVPGSGLIMLQPSRRSVPPLAGTYTAVGSIGDHSQ